MRSGERIARGSQEERREKIRRNRLGQEKMEVRALR
jgi:hypothetical protein